VGKDVVRWCAAVGDKERGRSKDESGLRSHDERQCHSIIVYDLIKGVFGFTF